MCSLTYHKASSWAGLHLWTKTQVSAFWFLCPSFRHARSLRSVGVHSEARPSGLDCRMPFDFNPLLHPASATGASYLNYVTLMNQVIMMGTQIYHDACDTQHHKYVAHQLALLYVSRLKS